MLPPPDMAVPWPLIGSRRLPKTRVKRKRPRRFRLGRWSALNIEFRLAALREPERPENAHGVFV